MKANYHTHTTRCHHALGEDEAYAQAALKAGFDVLGFSDHAPWPFASGYVSRIRMTVEELPGYVASIRGLRERYADRLSIHIGLESEYFPRYHDHLLRMRDAGVEYYILGQHFVDSEEDSPYVGSDSRTDEGVLRYADSAVRAIRTGLFRYVAHPDLFMRRRNVSQFTKACEQAADMICQAAMEQHMPLEYNLLGRSEQLDGTDDPNSGYPSAPFWAYARRYNCPVIRGVDAHDPHDLANASVWTLGTQELEALGYTILDHLEMEG